MLGLTVPPTLLAIADEGAHGHDRISLGGRAEGAKERTTIAIASNQAKIEVARLKGMVIQ